MRSILSIFIFAIWLSGTAYSQQEIPVDRQRTEVSRHIGDLQVTVSFEQFTDVDRANWGSVLPYGHVWRIGSNRNTTLKLSEDAKINGYAIKAGTYGIFFIPHEQKEWYLVINKDSQSAGTDKYIEQLDVVRLPIKQEKAPYTEEVIFGFDSVSKENAQVYFHWRDFKLPFVIENIDGDAKSN